MPWRANCELRPQMAVLSARTTINLPLWPTRATRAYVQRFLRLALLAPPIVEAIMAGKAPRTLSLTKLDTSLPFSWQEQLKLFGMA